MSVVPCREKQLRLEQTQSVSCHLLSRLPFKDDKKIGFSCKFGTLGAEENTLHWKILNRLSRTKWHEILLGVLIIRTLARLTHFLKSTVSTRTEEKHQNLFFVICHFGALSVPQPGFHENPSRIFQNEPKPEHQLLSKVLL